jgi:ABC-type multidrug transport system fused ATPase/permease subunit
MGISLSIDFGIDEIALKLLIVIDAIILGQALAELLDQRRPKKVFTPNIIERLNAMQAYPGHKIEATKILGNIELIRLSFSYPESSILLFNNFSQSFKAGHCYVLSGPSGCGKSSLLRLLMGFYDPRSGYVIVDGQDIRSLKLSSLRRNFGYVGQNSRLFGGSIAENIVAGRNISKEAVLDLLLSHAIFDHILDLPMSLETFVFPRSYHLSLIQINLILLARALVHRPAFLFLDEILVGMSIDEQRQFADFLGSLSITRILVSHQKMPRTLEHEEICLKAQ